MPYCLMLIGWHNVLDWLFYHPVVNADHSERMKYTCQKKEACILVILRLISIFYIGHKNETSYVY